MIPTATVTLDEIVRLREAPGRYVAGVWQPGDTTETTLLASVQPLELEDSDFVGGVQLRDRLKVYAPNLEVAAAHGDRLMWGDDVLLWGSGLLRWNAVGGLTDAAAPVLEAAFDDSGADRVRVNGQVFVVESSMSWPSHTEAVLLRET